MDTTDILLKVVSGLLSGVFLFAYQTTYSRLARRTDEREKREAQDNNKKKEKLESLLMKENHKVNPLVKTNFCHFLSWI